MITTPDASRSPNRAGGEKDGPLCWAGPSEQVTPSNGKGRPNIDLLVTYDVFGDMGAVDPGQCSCAIVHAARLNLVRRRCTAG